MRLAVLYSGGKDSTMTIYKALKEGHDVKYIISLISENPASYMFHYPNISLTEAISECIGIPRIVWSTKGEKEKELEDLEAAISKIKDEIDGVGAGALASKYQYDRVSNICKDLDLKTYTPCWQEDPEKHWKEILDAGFEVIITGVAAGGMGKDLLGKKVDWDLVDQLRKIKDKHGIHLGFEGGEAESLVLNGPLFKKKIEILQSHIDWDKKTESGHLVIDKIKIVDK